MRKPTELGGDAVSFVMQDPAIAYALLFRSFSPGYRPKGLEVTSEHAGSRFTFTCWEWLDVRDQSVLLAVVGMAAMGQELYSDSSDPIDIALWEKLSPRHGLVNSVAPVFATTCYKLLKAAGHYTRIQDYKRLKDSLYRLSQVGCRVHEHDKEYSMQLLSYLTTPDGNIQIALNSRFTDIFSSGQYIRVSLDERRKLRLDCSKLLHAWLTTSINPGSAGYWTKVDSLVMKVWGVPSNVPSTERSRRAQICSALKEIGKLDGWGVKTLYKGAQAQVQVKRPRLDVKRLV